MSTITIKNPATTTPAFVMSVCGHASAAAGTTSAIFGGAHAYLPTTGGVAFWAKRRNVKGSPAWRPPV